MRLISIELENFKTFKKCKIPFVDGFTAITGSNASGKSNIADAILFVLGSTSKNIRVDKLSELIFTTAKSKSNYCKVTLTFENKDNKIPINSDYVRFTRVVKISKTNPENYYSYFYINSKQCSLNEFMNVLSVSNLQYNYNIVQQGDINNIATMTKTERRKYLEEISGISKFDTDICNAEAKRKETEVNIQQINILLDEIRNRLKDLEKDREEAIKYRNLQLSLQNSKYAYIYKEKVALEKELEKTNTSIDNYEKSIQKCNEKINALNIEAEKCTRELEDIDKKLKDLTYANDLVNELQEKKISVIRYEESIKNNKYIINGLLQEKYHIETSLKDTEKSINDLRKKKTQFESTAKEFEKKILELDIELEKVKNKIKNSSSETKKIAHELQLLKKLYNDAEEKSAHVKLNYEIEIQKEHELQTKIKKLEDDISTYEAELKALAIEEKNLHIENTQHNENIKNGKKRLIEINNLQYNLQTKLQNLEFIIKKNHTEYYKLKAEYDSKSLMPYSQAVQAILDAKINNKLKGIHNVVSELAEIKKEYDVAVSIAAGSRIQAIVVDDDLCAEQCINYLKKNNLGVATFLPLNKMRGGMPRGKALMVVNSDGAIGFAADLITYDALYKDVFWYVLGDTVIMKDLPSARKQMGGVRLVTLDGTLIETSGAMIGGMVKVTQTFGKTLNELRTKELELVEKNAERDLLISKNIDLENERTKLEDKIRVWMNENEGIELKLKTIVRESKECSKNITTTKNDYEQVFNQLTEIQEKIKKYMNELENYNALLKDYEQKKNKFSVVLHELTTDRLVESNEKLKNEISKLKDEYNAINSNITTLTTQTEIYDKNRNDLTNRYKEIDKQITQNKTEIENYMLKIDELNKSIATLKGVEEKLGAEAKQLTQKRTSINEKISEINTQITKLKQEVDVAYTIINCTTGLKQKIIDIENNLAGVVTELAKYDIKEVSNEFIQESMSRLKETISNLESQLQYFGVVNLKAIEDYDKEKEREKKLLQDLTILENEKKSLIELTEKLQIEKKNTFLKTFEIINNNFKNLCIKLTNNVLEAELVLESQESIFDKGVMIKIKENKLSASIARASGAQKSLLALALVFSVQAYSPAPLYVLDEVDMFLDAFNAKMVSEFIKSCSLKAQFILISLRKITIQNATHVYGVVKNENHISTLIGKIDVDKTFPVAK